MNAICLHIAQRKGIKPTDVEVELEWDEDHGYSAQVFTGGRSQYLVEANMLEALERYLFTQHGLRVFRDQIRLDIDEEAQEMIAWVDN
jgi:hypothetical protein